MTNCLLQIGLLYKSQNFCRNEPCKASENRLYETRFGCRQNLAVSANIGKKKDGSFPV